MSNTGHKVQDNMFDVMLFSEKHNLDIKNFLEQSYDNPSVISGS